VKFFVDENPEVPIKRIESWIKDIGELEERVTKEWNEFLKEANSNSKKIG
jgi:hypothetical protein